MSICCIMCCDMMVLVIGCVLWCTCVFEQPVINFPIAMIHYHFSIGREKEIKRMPTAIEQFPAHFRLSNLGNFSDLAKAFENRDISYQIMRND